MTQHTRDSIEFSRKLRLDKLAGGPVERSLEAKPEECRQLCARLGLDGLSALTGTLSVSRLIDSPLIRVEGSFAAHVRQTCVVKLEPFDAKVGESFVQLYTLDPAAAEAEEGEVFVALEEDDTPEPLTGDSLDLGEVLAEQLALALDPHPRAPDAEFDPARYGVAPDEDEEPDDTPFAVLRQLKRDG
ncbi:hypothetical protein CKO28_11450 [Rhodovibrio sodomensis]|uniref:DUF177 domain-containing protein n=1 Tax=Rhodovibrio sodomensis TaxID=1088 RepID=A0ABS1DFH8_9PROT|nr:DUF177 domain-containing protein [Rhodovibrio sodomensis]MBK1668644.1 hypothetical protein [Rhodovibrio sodomensis]